MTSAHAPSLYAATADAALAFPPLTESVKAHVAVVGGGYTGLSAALHLAEAGIDVVLVEAERVGWGASGRNGGQLHSGQRRDQEWLEEHLGKDEARRLWVLAEEAKATTLGLIDKHQIACDWRPGLIETVHKERLVAGEIAYVDKLRRDYACDAVAWLDRDALAAAIGTDVYFGGRRDTSAGHLDPLKFAQGLARAATKAGARIFEGTRATSLDRKGASMIEIACTPAGFEIASSGAPSVSAEIVILAGNGYLDGIDAEVEARVMPIDNYILATRADRRRTAGRTHSRRRSSLRYALRRLLLPAKRRWPAGLRWRRNLRQAVREGDIAAMVRKHLARIYPQLADTPVDYAWGGTLAITLNRLPYIRRVRPGVYAAAGYSGQGVALAPFAGKMLAEAIAGNPARLDTFAALPVPTFPGGKLLRFPALVAAMTWYRLRDAL